MRALRRSLTVLVVALVTATMSVGVSAAAAPAPACDVVPGAQGAVYTVATITFAPGESLARGESIGCGSLVVAHQSDGNVVAYRDGFAFWYTATSGPSTGFVMQGDGNAVLYDGDRPLWNSATGTPGSSFVISADAEHSRAIVWSPDRTVVRNLLGRCEDDTLVQHRNRKGITSSEVELWRGPCGYQAVADWATDVAEYPDSAFLETQVELQQGGARVPGSFGAAAVESDAATSQNRVPDNGQPFRAVAYFYVDGKLVRVLATDYRR